MRVGASIVAVSISLAGLSVASCAPKDDLPADDSAVGSQAATRQNYHHWPSGPVSGRELA